MLTNNQKVYIVECIPLILSLTTFYIIYIFLHKKGLDMFEHKALYYGQVEIIPGIICDGYVLDDDTAVLSEHGTADLLGIRHRALQVMSANWPPVFLQPFVENENPVAGNLVEVATPKSPHCGRKIVVYTSGAVETLIRAYALALTHGNLRQNQVHIGKRAVVLLSTLVRTALEMAIKEACGIRPQVQATIQHNLVDVIATMQELGFRCSVNDEIATKKDMARFFEVPETTLNYFLTKYNQDIQPMQLSSADIKAMGSKAKKIYGYHIEDVAKLALRMNTPATLELKKRMFGEIAELADMDPKSETQWRIAIARMFQGFNLKYNFPVGKYRVDFFVEEFQLALECNEYGHHSYNPQEEAKREKLILQSYALVRFHHQVTLTALFNAILRAQIGMVINLNDPDDLVK